MTQINDGRAWRLMASREVIYEARRGRRSEVVARSSDITIWLPNGDGSFPSSFGCDKYWCSLSYLHSHSFVGWGEVEVPESLVHPILQAFLVWPQPMVPVIRDILRESYLALPLIEQQQTWLDHWRNI